MKVRDVAGLRLGHEANPDAAEQAPGEDALAGGAKHNVLWRDFGLQPFEKGRAAGGLLGDEAMVREVLLAEG